MLSATATTIAVTAILALYIGYRLALPKPLPGIPYNAESANRIMGDVPKLMAEVSKTGDYVVWLRDQNLKSRSIINQVFLRPFGRPIVVLTDYRESRDIQVHRGKEFDRSSHIIEIFRPLANRQMFALKTGPEWKMHRRLVQDTMSPSFLNEVAAPSIYASGLGFVDLWNTKTRLANGRPFSATNDLHHVTFDAVLAFTFGSKFPHSAIQPQAQGLQSLSTDGLVSNPSIDEPVEFPLFDIDEEIGSILKLAHGLERVVGAPSPRLKWAFITRTTSFKKLRKWMDDCFWLEIEKAVENRQQNVADTSQSWVHNAVDHIIDREDKLAQKEHRQPDFFSTVIKDEIQGFVIAGHDTTSGSMCWAVKLLADHHIAQSRLREALQSAFATAISENRMPSVREITVTSVPYLDATIEELFRVGGPVPLNNREATQDAVVLGHVIPKGTTVMFLQNGPSILMPAGEIDESRRSKRSQEDQKQGRQKAWNDDDIALFKPERWLVAAQPDGNGNGNTLENLTEKAGSEADVVFDTNAGPTNPFGLGMRGCFGRRLAYLEFRILLIMMIWNFELLECPQELSGYYGKLGVVYKPHQCFVRLKKLDHSVDV